MSRGSSGSSSLVVVGDDFMTVRLFNYPALPNSEHKKFRGHHSHVMAVRFIECGSASESSNKGGFHQDKTSIDSKKEWMVVSAGGLDRCVFLWRVRG